MHFMNLGRDVHVVGEPTAPSIRKGDGLVMVSGSGETPVSVSFARIAKGENAEVILLTHNRKARSPILRMRFSSCQSTTRNNSAAACSTR